MAGNANGGSIEVIDVSLLWQVWGGADKQTETARAAIAQATGSIQALAKKLEPQPGIADVMLQVMSSRRSGSGPSSAPALPPTSTLTR